MKITDNGNFTTVELETETGQQNFLSGMKAQDPNDRRGWQRDVETMELAHFMMKNDRTNHVVVKCGDVHKKI
jgi:hypothetical protein